MKINLECNRYAVNFNSEVISKEYHDVIIIGSGIAGVYTALDISPEYEIAILTKETIEISTPVLAQGGIAVSLDKKDSPELHFRDTISAGAGLCNEESVWVLVNEAEKNIRQLCRYGVNFDQRIPGELALTREAAHSMNRIIHAGDTTGKEVCDKLISVVRTKENVGIFERTFAVDIITRGDGSCAGVLAYDEDKSEYRIFFSNVVICAAGGFGQLYAHTTNPEIATGDGLCMAFRAGAKLTDMEFIQFHPTVLNHPANKSFLISEAVRGEGAVLRNSLGQRFMQDYHEKMELAPRDVVTRAIFEEMRRTGSPNVYLDITFKEKEYLENRFPNIYKTCLKYGIDISKDFIPVAPAEHYCMGGIRTDIYGRTGIKGFYACGEAACTGIHGANRLASNSLLEGLVFGHKIGSEVSAILKEKTAEASGFDMKINYIVPRKKTGICHQETRDKIRRIMTDKVGIIRSGGSMEEAKAEMRQLWNIYSGAAHESVAEIEIENMLMLAMLVIDAALMRKESRGAHYRKDFSVTDDENWKKSIDEVRSAADVLSGIDGCKAEGGGEKWLEQA